MMKQHGPRFLFKCEMLSNCFKELYARLGLIKFSHAYIISFFKENMFVCQFHRNFTEGMNYKTRNE